MTMRSRCHTSTYLHDTTICAIVPGNFVRRNAEKQPLHLVRASTLALKETFENARALALGTRRAPGAVVSRRSRTTSPANRPAPVLGSHAPNTPAPRGRAPAHPRTWCTAPTSPPGSRPRDASRRRARGPPRAGPGSRRAPSGRPWLPARSRHARVRRRPRRTPRAHRHVDIRGRGRRGQGGADHPLVVLQGHAGRRAVSGEACRARPTTPTRNRSAARSSSAARPGTGRSRRESHRAPRRAGPGRRAGRGRPPPTARRRRARRVDVRDLDVEGIEDIGRDRP